MVLDGKGHRQLRLCSKKNYERKKYTSRIRAPLQDISKLTNTPEESNEEPVLTITSLKNT